MSFSSDTKKELTTLPIGKKCCELALITGFLRFAGSVTIEGGKMGLKVCTENPAAARLFASSVKDYFGVRTDLFMGENALGSRVYFLSVSSEMNAEGILRETGVLGVKEGGSYINAGLSPEIVKKRCCKKAALRGIFLAAGYVSDPGKARHLEILCDSEQLAGDVKRLMGAPGLRPRVIKRRGKFSVYLKDGEQISDLLGFMGASGQLLRLQDVMVTKEVRNLANRVANCENANLERAVEAAQKQIADIKYIKEKKGIDFLSEKLRQAAELRLAFEELSLTELAEHTDPPIGKSGLGHRFAKISSIADELRKGNR